MVDPATDPATDPVPDPAPPPEVDARLERRAGLLLLLFVLLVGASIVYLLYARGAFEATQRLVLVADDSEGVQVGMDLTFSGFAVGRVSRIELAADGSARILVDVPLRDARWLRSSSVFTMTRSLLGGTAIRAYSGILSDPPLPDGAERSVLLGDAAADVPRIMNEVRGLVANLTALTASDSALATALDKVNQVTTRVESGMAGKRGALDLLLGAEAPKLITTLERSNQLLANLDALVRRTDGVVGRADEKLLGDQGLVVDGQATVRQLNQLLTEARASLGKVDAVLREAELVARNARVASTDLGQLRAEVESSLRKVEQLVNEVNRLWPFKRDTEVKLP
ncbi:MAG: MCE family protein [Rubrivivax sp.]|nr:MCE family protein [Rubrivivax sp.]MBK7261204.1 MCE family protein [Rubrivivax sp.]